jgi:serine/threonine-protein kinase RsbW
LGPTGREERLPAEDEVRLAVPATPEFLRLARLTASGVASRLGFSFDEVEDLRLALDELCFALIGTSGRAGQVEVRYAVVDGALEVQGVGAFEPEGPTPEPESSADDGRELALSDLSQQILAALVDKHSVYRDEAGQPCFRVIKRRHGPR